MVDPVVVSPRVERSPIFVEASYGVMSRLTDLYSARSKVHSDSIPVLAISDPEGLEKALQAQSVPLSLPAIGVSLSSVEPNDQSYNKTVARKHGITIQVDDTRDSWYALKITPTYVTFQVTMITDDFLTMLRMIDRWISNEVWGFILQVNESQIKVSIQMIADKSISVPPRTPDSAGADRFKLVTSLKVSTYCGYIWRIPSIRAIQPVIRVTKHNVVNWLEATPNDYVDIPGHRLTSPVLEPLF